MNQRHQTICVIGLGYIGLPTAALLASRGYQVIGVDTNQAVVDSANAGNAHIAETDLDILVRAAVATGSLVARTKPEPADVYIVAVPTPLNADKSPDLTAVEAAFDSIAPHLKQGDLVILESTCPVGTTDAMVERLNSQRPDLPRKIHVAYCPERVLPGQILKELVENDRVVGGITPACTQKVLDFYQSFVKGECFPTDSKTAELCKLTENSFRDVNIAFANELSIICDQQGIDVWQLIKLANRHPRVNVLQPGCGVGGHCIAIDPWFIVNQAPESTQLLQAARAVNDSKTQWVLQKIHNAVADYQKTLGALPKIACLGITFKANIDDVRESPALEIVANLAEKYSNQILVVEPNLKLLPTTLQNKPIQHVSLDQASHKADLLVLLVDHKEFKNPPINSHKKQTVLDFKGLWSTQ
ncbi:UDP-N-acetyl-D-mannosamine dehydrogenase [Fluviibacter phosphoraccumulans]|uniref:UDP-N-acetyl-D-mannosamine dehydrogenase n=1 Tax=Fluviibacter phosphoraccumulans TaxID=1751046 RepID=A0A7R6TQ35_9RHOO|nr:UDP-N-acetyl-D-mannosamine dehydrogenase [Fluviibacter phosphoraccumulans]BBU69669.1 UDP-N-acetyl-D-mannosamine dehydrogenase [Fluviibacter phosphoraccumulans]BBU71148.1 UDP-N-acetyl-D-mannosamine dehydrogenase [Fluviibacter phosphoraccumulans]